MLHFNTSSSKLFGNMVVVTQCVSLHQCIYHPLVVMTSDADFEIDLTASGRDVADEERDLTAREKDLRKTFGYKTALVQPSQLLGNGSYGNVVKATLDGLPCAAKILHDIFFTTSDPHVVTFTQRFQQECRILRHLRHPRIVQFLGVIEDPRAQSNGRPILLMELMDESLTDFLGKSQKPLPYHIQVNLTYDIALALDYLHANGIQHRDLSSNNILLVAGTQAKLTDFGMSKAFDLNPCMTRNQQTACPGTLAFMPPEALRTEPVYSDKIDVFSTGVLMVQIITRKYPNPSEPHNAVYDSKYGTTILVPVPELERRKNDLCKVFMTHPLRSIALECISDKDKERPTASVLCQHLVHIRATPEYFRSLSEYGQQVVEMSPTKITCEMRDMEIEMLQSEMEALTLEKNRSGRDKSKLDADIADLHQREEPLLRDREHELEKERKRVEMESIFSENVKLVQYNERLEREKEHAISEQSRLHLKIAELKEIIRNVLQQTSVTEEGTEKGNKVDRPLPQQNFFKVE